MITLTDFKNETFCFGLENGEEIKINLGGYWIQGFTSDFRKFNISIAPEVLEKTYSENGTIKFVGGGLDRPAGIAWCVDFHLMTDPPKAQWKISVENWSEQPVLIRQIGLFGGQNDVQPRFVVNGKKNTRDLSFFSNGWQSWSYTGVYQSDDRMHRTRLGLLQAQMVINPDTPVYKEKGKFSSDFFAVIADKKSEVGFILDFLSQKRQFGTITADFRQQPS